MRGSLFIALAATKKYHSGYPNDHAEAVGPNVNDSHHHWDLSVLDEISLRRRHSEAESIAKVPCAA